MPKTISLSDISYSANVHIFSSSSFDLNKNSPFKTFFLQDWEQEMEKRAEGIFTLHWLSSLLLRPRRRRSFVSSVKKFSMGKRNIEFFNYFASFWIVLPLLRIHEWLHDKKYKWRGGVFVIKHMHNLQTRYCLDSKIIYFILELPWGNVWQATFVLYIFA